MANNLVAATRYTSLRFIFLFEIDFSTDMSQRMQSYAAYPLYPWMLADPESLRFAKFHSLQSNDEDNFHSPPRDV